MNNLYKKNIENIINYLLTFDVENIKFIWIKRIKKNNTIKKEVIVENVVLEDGYSISFDSHNVNFMLALDKLNNFNHIKNQIKLFLKSNNIKKIKNIKKFKLESVSCFNKNKNKSVFDCKKYQEEIIKFLNNNSNTSISIQLLYENKNTLIVRPFIKNIYKEEFNYKMDILMNYIVNKLHRFNYKSIGNANNFEKILNFNIHNEFVNLQKTLLKMDTLHNFEQKCDVVICKGIGGILFHEICGHSLESREIIKKNSIFYDVKDVNNKNINFIDDATIANEFGFYNIDDEGNTSKKLPLIKNGKIVNYLCDERGKKILLQKFSSSCRRETYYNKFSSRMSNTYIEKGDCEVKDIVTSVENGFYIKNILGGVVDTTSGNFSFNCLESYRIKNGLIDFSKCYDNLTIVGNAMQIIKNVDKIGNDFELNCGICGSDSGFVYTTVGQPTIKVKDVLVVS